jgi:hypothetical protein
MLIKTLKILPDRGENLCFVCYNRLFPGLISWDYPFKKRHFGLLGDGLGKQHIWAHLLKQQTSIAVYYAHRPRKTNYRLPFTFSVCIYIYMYICIHMFSVCMQVYLCMYIYMYTYGKRKSRLFFNPFTVCSSYKRRLSVCKRTKRIEWTKRTCPSISSVKEIQRILQLRGKSLHSQKIGRKWEVTLDVCNLENILPFISDW